jgi:hypothetical protein
LWAWAWARRGWKVGGGEERKVQRSTFNVQNSTIINKVEFWHVMLKPRAAPVRPEFPTLTNVAASQTKYTHISGIKIDKIVKILEPIDMIKRHGLLC